MTHGGHYGGVSRFHVECRRRMDSRLWPCISFTCNNVPNTLTQTNQAAQALYTNAAGAGPSARSDPMALQLVHQCAPTSHASPLPVGARSPARFLSTILSIPMRRPPTCGWVLIRHALCNRRQWRFSELDQALSLYRVRATDANGNFIIPNVIATNNYTLYAFGSRCGGHAVSIAIANR